MSDNQGNSFSFAELEEMATDYNEGRMKPWQEAAIQLQLATEATMKESPPARTGIEWLGNILDFFFKDNNCDEPTEQLLSAKEQFLEAIEDEDVSPYAAFNKIISTNAFAQQMDALYARYGGIHYYIKNILPRFGPNQFEDDALVTEAREAARRRRVEAIKSLMAREKMRETSRGPATEALQPADGVGQGHDGEAEQSETRNTFEVVINIKDKNQLS